MTAQQSLLFRVVMSMGMRQRPSGRAYSGRTNLAPATVISARCASH